VVRLRRSRQLLNQKYQEIYFLFGVPIIGQILYAVHNLFYMLDRYFINSGKVLQYCCLFDCSSDINTLNQEHDMQNSNQRGSL